MAGLVFLGLAVLSLVFTVTAAEALNGLGSLIFSKTGCVCGYDRSGLAPTQACPECGLSLMDARENRIRTHRRRVLWILGVGAVVVAASTVGLVQSIVPEKVIVMGGASLVSLLPCVLVAIRGRRAVGRPMNVTIVVGAGLAALMCVHGLAWGFHLTKPEMDMSWAFGLAFGTPSSAMAMAVLAGLGWLLNVERRRGV